MLHKFFVLASACIFSYASYAIDIGNESTADKADRFDFESFHKEKGVTLWEEKKEKTATIYEENIKSEKSVTAPAATKTVSTAKKFEKGEVLNVREVYKLGNDPAQRAVQSLYEATEALHKQLNSHCPNGWAKEREWHKPEAASFYIYYQAACL